MSASKKNFSVFFDDFVAEFEVLVEQIWQKRKYETVALIGEKALVDCDLVKSFENFVDENAETVDVDVAVFVKINLKLG